MQVRKLKKGQIIEAVCTTLVSEGLGLSHPLCPPDTYAPMTGFVWGVLPGEKFLARIGRVKSGHFHGVLISQAEVPENWIGESSPEPQESLPQAPAPREKSQATGENSSALLEAPVQSPAIPDEKSREAAQGATLNGAPLAFLDPKWALLERSPERTEPPCPHFVECGGCKMMHLPYEKSLEYKKEWYLTQLTRNHVEIIPEVEIITGEHRFHYRNHVQVHINKYKERGFYAPYSYRTHRFPEEGCKIFRQDLVDQVFPEELELERCVRARIDHKSENAGVWSLYSKEDKAAHFSYNIEFPENSTTKVTLPNTAFFQTNTTILPLWLGHMGKLLDETLAQEEKPRRVLELFCGIGFISGMLAWQRKLEVLGIDILKPKDLGQTRFENSDFTHKDFDAERKSFFEKYIQHDLTILDQMKPEKIQQIVDFSPELLLMNPPRSGFLPPQIDFYMKEISAKVEPGARLPIIYSSCNGATMARDIAKLQEFGYTLQEIALFDFFPWTSHYEVVALLK